MAADGELVEAAFQEFLQNHKPSETSFMDVLTGFFHAIRWREPFIITLLSVHLFLLIFAVLIRRHLRIQGTLWLVLLAAVYSAERLNTLGSRRWREFATQDYFDRNGVFISLLFSLPLIVITLYIVVNFVLHAGRLLVKVKRAEFRAQIEAKKKGKQE